MHIRTQHGLQLVSKLISTQKAKALQPYLSFTIEDSRVNFFRNEIFPIDSMLTDNGQESAMLLEI